MLKMGVTNSLRGYDSWIPRWQNACGTNPSVNSIFDAIDANALPVHNPSGAGGEILYRDPATLNLVELSAQGNGGKYLHLNTNTLTPEWLAIAQGGGTAGGGSSIVVAASNADATVKARADYVCTGTNDDVLIQEAINSLTNGGRVMLTDGTYTIGSTILIEANNITLQGQGNTATTINTTATNINGIQMGNRQSSGNMTNNMRLIGLSINLPSASSYTPLYINGMGEGGFIQNVSVHQGGRGAILKDLDRCLIIDLEAFNPNVAGISCQTGLENTWGTVTFINCSTVLSNNNTIGWHWESAPEQASPNPFDRVTIIGSLCFQTGGLTGCVGMQMDVGATSFVVEGSLFEQNDTHFVSNATSHMTFRNCTFLNSVATSADCLHLAASGSYSVYDCRFQQTTNVFNGASGNPTVYVGGLNTNQGNITNIWAGTFAAKLGTDTQFAGASNLSMGLDSANFDANYLNKTGLVEQGNTPTPDSVAGYMYFKSADHNPYVMTTKGVEYQINLTQTGTTPPSNPPKSNVLPSGGSGGTGGNTNPPAPNNTYQDGTVALYSQHSSLSDFNSTSPTTVGSESVVSLANGSPSGTDYCFEWTVAANSNEVGLDKDLSGSYVRVCRLDFKLDSAATLSNEHTFLNMWTDHYGQGLVQIRCAPRDINGNGDYVFCLYANANSQGVYQSSKYSFDHFQRNTWYSLELYMNDNGFELRAAPYGSPLKTIIDWYGFSNQGLYMGGIALSKFYSTNLVGHYYIHAPKWLADYIYPVMPSSLSQEISNAYQGWLNRYVRTDGLVRRPNPQGNNGAFQPASDNVSEATAYGMLLAVQMNDQATFDLIYSFDKAHLQRSNNGLSTGTHLSGWHVNDELMISDNSYPTSAVYDWNWASDAEMDKALALVWAAHRKANGNTGWATSSINYSTEATNVITDLKNYCFNTINGKAYQTSDSYQGSANPAEINPSYISPAAYQVFYTFTGDSFWTTAISGAYDLLTKDQSATMTDNSSSATHGQSETGVGYWSEWCGLNTSAAVVTPPNNRPIEYGYNAFRVPYRVYMDYLFNNSSNAKTLLTNSIRTDYINMWNTYKAIWAEINYNGTIAGQYEKSEMTLGAYLTLLAASSSDTTAAAIWTAKLASLYAQNPGGEYFMDSPTTSGQYVGQPSYFNDAWMIMGMLIKNGTFQNF